MPQLEAKVALIRIKRSSIGQMRKGLALLWAVEKIMGNGSQQRSSRKKRGPPKAASAGARPRRTPKAVSNVVPLASAQRSASAPLPKDTLPKGHEAQIMFFTGVQIVRNGTQG